MEHTAENVAAWVKVETHTMSYTELVSAYECLRHNELMDDENLWLELTDDGPVPADVLREQTP